MKKYFCDSGKVQGCPGFALVCQGFGTRVGKGMKLFTFFNFTKYGNTE